MKPIHMDCSLNSARFWLPGGLLFKVYGHLERVEVVKGQRVEIGTLLGLSGEKRGKTSGPHLI